MKKLIYTLLIITLTTGCEDPVSPALDYSQMEIHYQKSGGWIPVTSLSVNGADAMITGVEISQQGQSSDTLCEAANQTELNVLAEIFYGFDQYNDYYEPVDFHTDANYHQTVLIYKGKSDTVTVYDPDRVNLPSGLKRSIDEMEKMSDRLFKLVIQRDQLKRETES
ncbi:MAG: hypothetical protein AB7T22_12265 [Calditrichaceae bacterium]